MIGGASVAIDTVAGEKERGTRSKRCSSRRSRGGSWSSASSARSSSRTLLSSILSLLGLILRVSLRWPAASAGDTGDDGASAGGLKLSGLAMAAMFLVQIPLAVMGAGLLLAVSTFARNQKEASTYLMPVMMLFSSVSAMMTMFLKASAPLWWAFMPVTNAALVLKQALEGGSLARPSWASPARPRFSTPPSAVVLRHGGFPERAGSAQDLTRPPSTPGPFPQSAGTLLGEGGSEGSRSPLPK